MPGTTEYVRIGKLHALAVTTSARAEALPDIPTVAVFVPGYESSQWYGVGSAGNGSSSHMAGELLKMLAGVNVVHVPYRGQGPAMTDLLGGQLQVIFATMPGTEPSSLDRREPR